MFYFYLLALVCLLSCANGQLQVNTTQGVIEGTLATDGNYYTFYGIHYGGDTSGSNRFKAPTPPPPYPGVFHAIESGILCAQPSRRGSIGVEDCLRLNVFTSSTTPLKPVLVWLNGEEYATAGTNFLSFQNLVNQGIVVVQINYRLSIYGFLCLGVPEAPGNAGLRDIVQGLQWIQSNIAGFGGNPNNVILFGHGSGAAMVDLLTMSPQSRNLIHKAIVQSGSALSPWAISYNPIQVAESVGELLAYGGKTGSDLANHLSTTRVDLINSAISNIDLTNNTALFAPCIENVNLNPNDTFLSDAPINLLRAGNYSHIPYIAGYTDKEGTLRAEKVIIDGWLEKMQANFTNFLQVDLDYGANATAIERSIREYYFGQRLINMETIEDFLDYQGDTMILLSVIRGARERALTSSAPVRLLGFEYRGTLNSDWAFNTIPITGARHGAVKNYLLNTDLSSNIDNIVMASLLNRYVNFFNTGVPTLTVTATAGPEWNPITSTATNYLLYSGGGVTFDFAETPRTDPHSQRMTFWNNIYSNHYKAPQSVSSSWSIKSLGYLVVLTVVLTLF